MKRAWLIRQVLGVGSALALMVLTGCDVGLSCLPCAIRNDPRREADATVAQWAKETDEADPCRLDAMQHCTAAALLANDCGSACAVWAGRINELLQRDGDPMDLHNNEQGATCDGSIVARTCCAKLLDAGDLSTDGRCK